MPLVLQPAAGVAPSGIVVGPVDDPAPPVPLVLPGKGDLFPGSQSGDPGGQVNIVGDQQGLPFVYLDEKALVAAALEVVGKDLDDDSRSVDRDVALPLLKSLEHLPVVADRWQRMAGGGMLMLQLADAEVKQAEENDRENLFQFLPWQVSNQLWLSPVMGQENGGGAGI